MTNRTPLLSLLVVGSLAASACASSDGASADISGIADSIAPVETTEQEPTAEPPATEAPATDPPATVTPTPATDGAATTTDDTVPEAEPAPVALGPIDVTTADGSIVDEVRGELTEVGQVNRYTFDVIDRQSIIIEELGDCIVDGDDTLKVELDGPISTTAFLSEKDIADNEDCTDVTRVDADSSGTVAINVSFVSGEATGSYNFRIVDVTDGPVVPLEVGDTVSAAMPTPGSGQIESIGQHDVFSLNVTDGQSIAIEELGGCVYDGDDRLVLEVTGVEDVSLYFEEQDIDDAEDCEEVNRIDIENSGVLLLRARMLAESGVGTYNFRVLDVTDGPAIPLAYGDSVSDGVPAAGAGNIESFGAHDVYTVQVSAGDVLVVEGLGGCVFDGNDTLIVDLDGVVSQNVYLREQDLTDGSDCLDVQRFEIEDSGIVVMRVRDSDERATGTYSFRISNGAG